MSETKNVGPLRLYSRATIIGQDTWVANWSNIQQQTTNHTPTNTTMKIDIKHQRERILAYFAHRGIQPARGLDALEFAITEWNELLECFIRRDPQWTRNNPKDITDDDIIHEIGDAFMMMVLALENCASIDYHGSIHRLPCKKLCVKGINQLSATYLLFGMGYTEADIDYGIHKCIRVLYELSERLNLPEPTECAQCKFMHKTGSRFE